MQHRLIYRGYDIEIKEGTYTVSLNGQVLNMFESEQTALGWIDQERQERQRATKEKKK